MLYFLQQLANGLHMSAIYALLAFGYALTNGVLHRTNLAYGAMFGFAGQIMILAAIVGWQSLWLTLPATLVFGCATALAYGFLCGWVLSRSVFERLYAQSPNTIVTATLGVSLVLMELGRIASGTRDFWLPPLLSHPVVLAAGERFSVTLTVMQIGNCAVALLVLVASAWWLGRTRFGRDWRAVSDDPRAAALCGVDTGRVFRGAVILGGLFAALAGILAGLYFGNISFGTGLVFGLKVLFITAVGGYSQPLRAALGAAMFGMAETLWAGYFPIEWRDGWMFLLLVAMLVLRPPSREVSAFAHRP